MFHKKQRSHGKISLSTQAGLRLTSAGLFPALRMIDADAPLLPRLFCVFFPNSELEKLRLLPKKLRGGLGQPETQGLIFFRKGFLVDSW